MLSSLILNLLEKLITEFKPATYHFEWKTLAILYYTKLKSRPKVCLTTKGSQEFSKTSHIFNQMHSPRVGNLTQFNSVLNWFRLFRFQGTTEQVYFSTFSAKR